MTKMSEPIVFFGSGPVAAKALGLLNKNFEIEAVVTKPKPQHHRGDFPVLTLAEKLGLKTFLASNRQELSDLFATKPVKSNLGIVIDYGVIISKDVIDYFPLGIVNSHFSLLPRWRGADPITFSILNGDDKTGVSLMLIDESLDTGKLIAQKSLKLDAGITTPELTDQLIGISDKLLQDYLPGYANGQIVPRAQHHPKRATYSRKLTKDDGVIDWTKPAEVIEREVRAFTGWPGSRTTLAGKDVIITKAYIADESGEPSKVLTSNKRLVIFCGQGALEINELKPAGKNKMTAQEFLAGHKHLLT